MKSIMFSILSVMFLSVHSSFSQLLTLKEQLDIQVETLIDVDGDGIPEILGDSASYYDGKTLTLKYKNPGQYMLRSFNWDAPDPYYQYVHVDYNLDGRRDVICGTSNPASFSIIDVSTNTTLFSFSPTGYEYIYHLFLADIDGDGKLELMVTVYKTSPTYLYRTYIFSTSVPTTSIPNVSQRNPANLSLAQNFPNPFNPNTSIEYDIQSSSRATIRIYNSLGQHIRTLFDENKSPGTYVSQWDGKNENGVIVSSGVYFYQLQVGEFVSSKKMLMIK